MEQDESATETCRGQRKDCGLEVAPLGYHQVFFTLFYIIWVGGGVLGYTVSKTETINWL